MIKQKFILNIKDEEIELDREEAFELYKELKDIFQEKTVNSNPTYPISDRTGMHIESKGIKVDPNNPKINPDDLKELVKKKVPKNQNNILEKWGDELNKVKDRIIPNDIKR